MKKHMSVHSGSQFDLELYVISKQKYVIKFKKYVKQKKKIN
jgi:hypothetical protein